MERIDHLVVGKITFVEGGELVHPVGGVKGITAAAEEVPEAPAATEGTAGTTYGTAEQGIINSLVDQVNALTAALTATGQLQPAPETAPEPEAKAPATK